MNIKGPFLGFGSPLLDMLAHVPEEFIAELPGGKGGMMEVDAAWHNNIISRLPQKPFTAPGGSAGNTVFALARLGLSCAMLGKLNNDEAGVLYRDLFQARGGDTSCFIAGGTRPTGRCLSLVTPDGERTMRTDLGASTELTAEEVAGIDFSRFGGVLLEGYMLFNAPAFDKVCECVRHAGCVTAMDLASYEVVNIFRSKLDTVLREYVDIVFANQDEAGAFAPDCKDPESQLARLREYCDTAVVKLGADGALISSGDSKTVYVPACKVANVCDTTAAGDLWQAGFLGGLLRGMSLEESGKLGARLSGEVVKVLGSALPETVWEEILSGLK